MLICPLNVSESRPDRVEAIAAAAGDDLLDVHTDGWHNRSVLTVAGERAVQAVASTAVETIDLRRHHGVHPRLGAVDVVPFVPAVGDDLTAATEARERFVAWAGSTLRVPSFPYGHSDASELPSLPTVRREAFRTLRPAAGPALPHPTAGATAVGARPTLVAYNLWLAEADLNIARALAARLRQPSVRALGLQVGERVQVSLNLVDPLTFGPADAFDAVAAQTPVAGAELVGLVPERLIRPIPEERWGELDLSLDRTVESRLRRSGGP